MDATPVAKTNSNAIRPNTRKPANFPIRASAHLKTANTNLANARLHLNTAPATARRPKFRIRRELPVTGNIPAASVRQPIRNTVLRLMSASAIPVTANINPASVRLHIQETAKAKA